MRPAKDAPADDLRADGLRADGLSVETDELLLAADDDEAADDEAGEAAEADVVVVTRPEPRRAPRLARSYADTTGEATAAPIPRPAAEPLAERSGDGFQAAGDEPAAADARDAGDEPAAVGARAGADAQGVDPAAFGGSARADAQVESVTGDEAVEAASAADEHADDDSDVAGDNSRDRPDIALGHDADSTANDAGVRNAGGRGVGSADAPDDDAQTSGTGTGTGTGTGVSGPGERAEEAANGEATGDASGLTAVPDRNEEPAAAPAGTPAEGSVAPVAETAGARRVVSRREKQEEKDATQPPDLLSAVERLRTHAATLNLGLDVEAVSEARKEREGMLSQLDDYILPRLRRKDAPLLAVIGGSTGAGKSTLTNSLVRREVSRSGVLRPTTRSPVLVHHPYDSGAFLSQRILPRLTRVTSEAPEPLQPIDPNAPRITGLRLVPHDGMTPGMAIIDAPDIDSLVETNRDLAVQLLQAADLWIFVTTAARYADAMPWQMLRQAAERGVAVAVVLDRVPPEAFGELRVHLAQRLGERGLGGAPLFVIPETDPVDGFLPEEIVQPLQQWLRRVAGDERSRTMIAERTLKGVLSSLPDRTLVLADAADAQALAWYKLKQEIDAVFEPARQRLLQSMTDGSLITGEVSARWQGFVADGEFVRRLEGGPGTFAERVSAAVQRDGEVVEPLDVPVTQAISAAITAAVRQATEAVSSRWRHYPYGVSLADEPVPEFEATLDRSIRDWRVQVSAGVTAAVQTKADAVDEETAADVLFVVAVDERADGVDAADSIGAARRILGRFLGDDEVRALVTEARSDLVARAAVVLDQERQRLEKLLSGGGATARGESLRTAAAVLKEAR